MNYGWRLVTLYRSKDQDHPKEKKKKAKWLCEEALQIAVKRREAKSKGEQERFECRVPKNSKERRKPSSVISAKK